MDDTISMEFEEPCAGPSTSNLQSDGDSDTSDESDEESETMTLRKENSKLLPHLKGLMGEANLRYARGERETAKKMCYEVIRQAPNAYEPYLTLSQMYETTDLSKYKAYLMLASHMASNNPHIWCKMAEVYQQEGNLMEAIKCYSKSIKCDPKNVWFHKKRLELVEQKGDIKMILSCKQALANNAPRKQHDIIVNLVMEVAKEYFTQKNYPKAIEALKIPITRISSHVTKDVINMLLELLLLSERYSECLDIFTQFCGFTFELTVTEDNNIIVNSYLKPPNLEIDLKMKFIVCLIKLRSENLIPDLINSIITEENIEPVADLYLDVVEALMQMGYYHDALKLLIPMAKNCSLAGIWLKYAECLVACDMPEPAIEAYFTVISLAPSHIDVLYPLAMLLLQQDNKKEALEVLSQDLTTNRLDVAMLVEELKLLKQIGDWDKYWKRVELLLSRHCAVLKNPEELKIVMTQGTYREKIKELKSMRSFRSDNTDVTMDFEVTREPTVEEEYDIYKDILQVAIDKGEFGMLQKFTFMGLCSKRFYKFLEEIFLFAHYACILNKDSFHGYSIIRNFLIKYSSNALCWNWFTLVIQAPDDVRHSRFLDRYQTRISSQFLPLVVANVDFSTGNYISAINAYMNEFKQTRSAYSAFMLGVAMLQLYGQRTMDKNKKKVLVETITYLFLNYSKMRGPLLEHETCYNIGRMYQQLGIMYLAEYYYKKALKVTNKWIDSHPDILCLKRETAFNLHLIYKNAGNFIAARNVLMRYIVI